MFRENAKLFRVQTPDGTGMYVNADTVGTSFEKETNIPSSAHPMPKDDPGLVDDYNHYRVFSSKFAFGSLEQLCAWLYKPEWRKELHYLGYYIQHLQGPAWIGDTQAFYNPSKIKQTGASGLLELETS